MSSPERSPEKQSPNRREERELFIRQLEADFIFSSIDEMIMNYLPEEEEEADIDKLTKAEKIDLLNRIMDGLKEETEEEMEDYYAESFSKLICKEFGFLEGETVDYLEFDRVSIEDEKTEYRIFDTESKSPVLKSFNKMTDKEDTDRKNEKLSDINVAGGIYSIDVAYRFIHKFRQLIGRDIP